MSLRLDVLDECATRLANIQIANGYNNDVVAVFKKYTPGSHDDFPVIWVAVGNESREEPAEDAGLLKCSLPIDIVGYTRVATDIDNAALLTTALEMLIEDIDNCFSYSDSIPDRDNKFHPKAAIPGAQSWYITSIDPYLDEEQNNGVCVLRGVINYYKEI